MKRQITKAGLMTSGLGFGAWAIGGPFWQGDQPLGWGEVNDEESLAALRTAIDGGIRLIDTADLYGAGHSERVVGQALRESNEEVLVSTKCGFTFDEQSCDVRGSDIFPGYIERACEASLVRLGVERGEAVGVEVVHDQANLLGVENAKRVNGQCSIY